ncbi:hypothetical protein QUF73_21530 [Cytobacillus sp. NJ13]|nr:hypothetical protein [Cytobacillus sp. NJ13]
MKNKFIYLSVLVIFSLIQGFAGYSETNITQAKFLSNKHLAHEIFPEESVLTPLLHLKINPSHEIFPEENNRILDEFVNNNTSGDSTLNLHANGHELFPDDPNSFLKDII